jgi:hypothetical protein
MPKKSKAVDKKSKHHPVLPAITRRIGIVSSIDYSGTSLQTAFNAGVNDTTIGYSISQQPGTYDFASLKNAIRALDTDIAEPPLELIVTVGGLIVADAARAVVAHKPFLSIVGGVGATFPDSGTGFFFGGVNLQIFGQNVARVNYLVSNHGKAVNNICLVYNPLSHMSGLETLAWQLARPKRGPIVPTGNNPTTGANDSSTYASTFASIAANNSITAVVVSADPFFKQTMNDFIDAANSCGKYVCYPLQDYINVPQHTPKKTLATLYGPNLADIVHPPAQYQILGQKASTVLSSLSNVPFDTPTPIITDL